MSSHAPAQGSNFLTDGHSLKSWLLTLDHKRIGILYLLSVSAFFLLGGMFAMLVRLELLTPAGDLLLPDTYNRVFTGHGVMMVFFFLIPAIPGSLGNFLIPLMIGTRDVAFPRLNLLSWYLFMAGGTLTLFGIINGGVDTGWTFYPPYSSTYTTTNVMLVGIGVFINGFSSILTGVNFMVTIHRMRCPGMTWFRLPLFVWGQYATALIMVLGTPVVAITLVLLVLERAFHLGIFDPARGGDPILFQHLFWFYSHPAVYIMILPSMAVISELIAAFARKRIFGYHFVAFASIGIAVLGFLVWGHHLYVSGQSVYAGAIFSLLTMLVAIPSAIKVFNWAFTLYQGSISLQTPMLYGLGFIGLFTIGGLTGVFLATLGFDVHVHDTYFVVAHFHYVMVGGTIMGYLGGLHFWWPKITGRLYNEFWAKISALLVFVGFNLTFFPQFLLGYMGMPRRYHSYPEEFQVLNVMSTAGASVLAVGFILPTIYFIYSLKKGAVAGDNPWQARGLEWETASPPPTANFDEIPTVTREPYDYREHAEEQAAAGYRPAGVH
ncbi:MAG: cytochrome c oxidase subunit I [Thermoanaerobaculia bacterium]